MLKFGLLNHSTTQNFLRIAQGILHMACRYCSALEVMHIDFEFCSVFVFIQLKNSHSRKINGDNFRFCYMYKNSSGHHQQFCSQAVLEGIHDTNCSQTFPQLSPD